MVNRVRRGVAAEQCVELAAQRRGRLEGAVGAEVVLEEAVQRARDVAGDGIERLPLAAEALCGAGVDEAHAAEPAAQRGRVDAAGARGVLRIRRRAPLRGERGLE